MSVKDALIMKRVDNVATALQDVEVGDVVTVRLGKERFTVEAREKIPFGFKVAVKRIPKGEPILKYGEVIGKARTRIEEGALVHIHNLEGTRGRGDLDGRES
ncbi:MAG: UxaA family hydrolase [Candidatus Bathyarchaeota archaeon]|nr:UxaA family hydrolase [Candidatus Bathyarchaeota archaeon]